MSFTEFYRKHYKYHRFFTLDELPNDVKEDLQNLLDKQDKRIGYFVYNTYEVNNGEIRNTELSIAYYVRSHFPDILFNDHHIPTGIRFWRMRKVATAG